MATENLQEQENIDQSSVIGYKIPADAAKYASELEALGRELHMVVRRLQSVISKISDKRTEIRNGL